MMLVLVVLLVTTVLVGAALTTRDNAPAIGKNAASAAQATWSAESAANFAVGAITQATDLATLMGNDDTLSSTMVVNGAPVSIKVTNLAGTPPSDADRELIVTATAVVNGVDKVVEKHVTRLAGGEAPDAADPYLEEFAIFATDACTIQDTTRIGIWDLSPDAASSGALAKVGVGFSNAGSMEINAAAAFTRVGLYCDEDASLALETYLGGCSHASDYWKIPLNVPTLPGALPMVFSSLPDLGTDVKPSASTTVTVAAPGRYNDLTADSSSTVVLDGSTTPNLQFNDVTIQNGGTLRIRGAVSVYVAHNCTIDTGFVVFEDASSTVTFYLAKDLKLDHGAKVGIDPADTLTAPGVITTYVNPARCKLIALSTAYGGDSNPQWVFDHTSAAVGIIHNPLGLLRLQHDALMCGHAVACDFRLETGCSLFYCPMLDSRIGYSSPTGPFYDVDANPIPELVTILDDVASTTTNAEGFANLFNMEYQTAKTDGTLDLVDLTTSTVKTITETLNLGGLAIY